MLATVRVRKRRSALETRHVAIGAGTYRITAASAMRPGEAQRVASENNGLARLSSRVIGTRQRFQMEPETGFKSGSNRGSIFVELSGWNRMLALTLEPISGRFRSISIGVSRGMLVTHVVVGIDLVCSDLERGLQLLTNQPHQNMRTIRARIFSCTIRSQALYLTWRQWI